jgi:Dyp-type peroxidase family
VTLDRSDIQGNVLRGYPHGHAAYLFARVTGAQRARLLLSDLIDDVCGDADWLEPPEWMLNVAFTFAGLDALGVDAGPFLQFEEFCAGMHARARDLLCDTGENDPDAWERGLRREAHVLFTIYGATQPLRDARTAALRRALETGGMDVVYRQDADCLANGCEHFGFRDGFSQPAVAGCRSPTHGQGVQRGLALGGRGLWRPLRVGEFILGHLDEDGVVPGARHPELRNGTFMVWRKLRQNVPALEAFVAAHAGDSESQQELLKAQIVGRWPDGTSLVRRRPGRARAGSPIPSKGGPDDRHAEPDNSFSYAGDPKGVQCPVGAHVRRANPRVGLGFRTERTRRHRILRRGVPYGDPYDASAPDDHDRGLIFVCYNASIERQFELIQRRWLMDGDTFGLGRDRDLLTGGAGPDHKMTIQGDRKRPPRFLRGEEQFVTVRGGYYLFAPGRAALNIIARP